MPTIEPSKARQFAIDVVRKLRDAGFEALWAGGCVRDQLLGLEPKDYDVATNATPNQIRQVFGHRRTLAIGAAFGVIGVVGSKPAGMIDVATFRRDAQYSDGRHPDSVTFSTAQEDAQRRDFTINGLFFDPLQEQVIDYVGGQQDLERRVIRAIGDAGQRIAEDKLRMLRAVRFAATFDFELDEATLRAIQGQAHELVIVSAERVAAEMRRMLVDRNRMRAVRLLDEAQLLEVVLPESARLKDAANESGDESPDSAWQRTLRVLDALSADARPSFPVALAALLREVYCEEPSRHDAVERICQRWRLSNEETDSTDWLLANESTLRAARGVAWPQLQRVLIAERIGDLLLLAEALARVVDGDTASIEYCRQRLALPAEQLNPAPLITGDDLKAAGIPPGPAYKALLETVRDAQLEGRIADKAQALELARQLWARSL
jgi:poly(A) polymerase